MKSLTLTTRRSLTVLPILLLAALIANGCKNGNSADNYPSAVRMINSIANSDSLSVAIDNKSVLGKIFYDDDSGYQGVNPGTYSFGAKVATQDSTIDIPPTTLDVQPNVRYTAVAYGAASEVNLPKIAILESPKNSSTASDKSTVRVFNAAVGTGKIDVLVNSIVAFKNVCYGATSDQIPLAALPYEWNIKPAGNSTDTYSGPTTLTLEAGHSYLVVIMGRTDNQSLQIKAYEN